MRACELTWWIIAATVFLVSHSRARACERVLPLSVRSSTGHAPPNIEPPVSTRTSSPSPSPRPDLILQYVPRFGGLLFLRCRSGQLFPRSNSVPRASQSVQRALALPPLCPSHLPPQPQMTENTVECAVAERGIRHTNFSTRRFARSRRAKGADHLRGLHIRPRFRSFPISPGWSLEESDPFARKPSATPDPERRAGRAA